MGVNWTAERAIGFMIGTLFAFLLSIGLASWSPWAFIAALGVLAIGIFAPRP